MTILGRVLAVAVPCVALLGVFGCSDEGAATSGPVDNTNVAKSSQEAFEKQKAALQSGPKPGASGSQPQPK